MSHNKGQTTPPFKPSEFGTWDGSNEDDQTTDEFPPGIIKPHFAFLVSPFVMSDKNTAQQHMFDCTGSENVICSKSTVKMSGGVCNFMVDGVKVPEQFHMKASSMVIKISPVLPRVLSKRLQ